MCLVEMEQREWGAGTYAYNETFSRSDDKRYMVLFLDHPGTGLSCLSLDVSNIKFEDHVSSIRVLPAQALAQASLPMIGRGRAAPCLSP